MKSYITLFILIISLSGCDLFNLSDSTDVVSGHWSSNVVPQAGHCCLVDLTLDSNKGDVVGSGTISTPSQQVGNADSFAIEVTGSVINDRINLSLASEYNPGKIEGRVIKDFSDAFPVVLEVSFTGFGHSGDNIILYPR